MFAPYYYGRSFDYPMPPARYAMSSYADYPHWHASRHYPSHYHRSYDPLYHDHGLMDLALWSDPVPTMPRYTISRQQAARRQQQQQQLQQQQLQHQQLQHQQTRQQHHQQQLQAQAQQPLQQQQQHPGQQQLQALPSFSEFFDFEWPSLIDNDTGLASLDDVSFNIQSNSEGSTLVAKLPQGVNQDNVQVKVSGNNLRVRIEQHAQRSQRRPEEEKKYPEGAQQTQGNNEQQQSIDTAQRDAAVQSQPYYESSSYQMLERSFLLPGDADVSRLTSEVNDGVLTIKVPRRLQQALQNKAQSNVQAQSIATGTAPSGATVQEPHFTVESEPITKG